MKAGRRVGWGLADQGLSSLTNFALGILVARAVAPRSFGAFGIVFATYTIVLGISRAVGSEPLVVRYSARSHSAWRGGSEAATGTALIVGLAAGSLVMIAGLVAGGSVGDGFLALAITLPGLMVQDAWRFAFFARGVGMKAFLNDLVWAIALGLSIAVLAITDRESVQSFILAWGGSGGVAALAGSLQAGVVPRPSQARAWLNEHRDLVPRYLGEFAAIGSSHELTTFGVGAVVGLAGVGSLRGAELLLGPVNVLVFGIRLVALPEGVRSLSVSVSSLRLVSVTFSAVAGAAAALWAALLLLLPASVGEALLGAVWHRAYGLILPLGLSVVGSAVSSGAIAGLRALQAARRSLRVRLITSIMAITGGVGGAVAAGPFGAAWGLAIASLVSAVFWWWQLGIEMRDRDPGTPHRPAS